MTAPTCRVEILLSPESSIFDYFVLDSSLLDGADPLADDGVLVDITDDVRSVRIRRGRDRDLDEFRPGTCSIALNNDHRYYDPTNTSSPYYGNIEPMRQVYVTAVWNGVDYPLFRGFAQDWTVDYSRKTLPLAGVQLADALSILARQDLDEVAASYAGDLSGARVSRVLDLDEVNFPADLRSIGAGVTTFGDTTFGENALSYLQKCARSEGGVLFVTADGILTFEGRDTAPGSNVCTFSDTGSSSHISYVDIDQAMSPDLLYNRVICSGTTAVAQTASDATSQAAYQVRTLSRTGQLASNDADMLGQANYLLNRFKAPELRLRQVEVRAPALSSARMIELLGLELRDVVTVIRTPPGGGSPSTITQTALVDGIEWSITDGATMWDATVTLANGASVIGFILDDAAFGQLDDDFLVY